MSNNRDEDVYEKVMFQMMNLNVDYKNISDLRDFKLKIRNIIGLLFRGPFDISRANDYIYIGQAVKEHRPFHSDIMVPHGVGMQIKYDRSYRIGHWVRGNIYGYIHCKYPDGSIYHGEFGKTSHQPEGFGMCIQHGKTMYEGGWKDGKKHGEGIIIRFVQGTQKIMYVGKGYFDMNQGVGIHLQTVMEDKTTYIINHDYDTKEALPSFIPPASFKRTELSKYQPNPPQLNGTFRPGNANVVNQRDKAAEIRQRRAKEAVMTPEELKVYKAKAKAETRIKNKASKNGGRLKTLAEFKAERAARGKPGKLSSAPAPAPAPVPSGPVSYEVNPDDVSEGDDSDIEIVEDLTDDENEKIKLRKIKKKKQSDDDDDDNTCVICFANEIDCVILECGHLAICFECSKDKSFKRKCPICRRPIQRVIQTFKAR
jgi:hypothetical protein